MAQLPTLTSVMGRLPKAPQVPNGFRGLESCRRGFSSSRLKYACRVVVSMRSSLGWKRSSAQRPRDRKKPPRESGQKRAPS